MPKYAKYKQLYIGLALHLLLSLCATSLFAGQATLSWTPPQTNVDDLAGYKIYYGTESGNYINIVDAGNVTNYQINNLTDGLTHFFTVTAYDTSGNESEYSKEVAKFIQTSPPPPDTSGNTSGYPDDTGEHVQSPPTPPEYSCDNEVLCRVVEVPVGSGPDDAEEYPSGGMNVAGSDLEFTYDGSNQVVGLRFNQVEIPQGATITNAYIQFQVYETNSEFTYLSIRGEDVNHAQPFTSENWNISSRLLTDEAVDWDVEPWTKVGEAEVDQQTPDIAAVIQEIVDRAGWKSGNSLAIIITGTGKRTAESYDGNQAGAPALHVEFNASTVEICDDGIDNDVDGLIDCYDPVCAAADVCKVICFNSTECNTGYYCAKPEGSCSSNGLCTLRPNICLPIISEVYGCDGLTYGNACEAAKSGVSVGYQSARLDMPAITGPLYGSTLSSPTETFTWTANGAAVNAWRLWAGPCDSEAYGGCGDDYYSSIQLGSGTLSATATGLPTDGSTVYIRLWYNISGTWDSVLYTYTAFSGPKPGDSCGSGLMYDCLFNCENASSLGDDSCDNGTNNTSTDSADFTCINNDNGDCDTIGPEITGPAPDNALSGSTETFSWTANGTSVTAWWLYIGTTAGGSNIHDSGELGTSTSTTVYGLPANGSTVHVQLWYETGGDWKSKEYTYTAYSNGGGVGGTPEIIGPAPDNALSGSTETFSWTANGTSVTAWWLYIGTTAGGSNIHDSGELGTSTSTTVYGLPANGSTVHVQLWYETGGDWKSKEYTYTAYSNGVGVGGTPEITGPAPDNALSGSTETFSWTANGTSVTAWWLYIGTTAGGSNIHDSGELGTSTSTTVYGLPANGSTVHVQLWYETGGGWKSKEYTYTTGL